MSRSAAIPVLFLALVVGGPALAAGSSCTLTLGTAGTITLVPQGNGMSTQASGGSAASIIVAAVLTRPTLIFSAPTVLGPTGWAGNPITAISFDTASGVHQAYTTAASSVQLGALADTVTINAAVANSSGFKAGSYTVSTTVTCQQ